MKSLIRMFTAVSFGAVVCVASLWSVAVMAQSDVAEFYKDKTVSVVIRSPPGGGYDFYGRLIARHLGKYLPGHPDVIAINRPGAGGLVATNYMYNRAPRDGTEILVPAREFALAERLDSPGVNYETLKMPLLGSVSQATRVWLAGPDVPVESLDDLASFREENGRDFRFAVSGKGSGSYQMSRLIQEGGYPVEIILGYNGISERTLAVLRGEADGMVNGYVTAREAINDEDFKVFAKLGNNPAVADIPSVKEGLSGNEKKLAEVIDGLIKIGRPFATAPGVPEERVAALQEAFRKIVKDPKAQKEAQRAGRSVSGYASPKEMREAYHRLFEAPDDVLELLRVDAE